MGINPQSGRRTSDGRGPPAADEVPLPVFLYELAMALDERSPDLVEAGLELGMGELQPASELTTEQVTALRNHVAARRRPPPLAPARGGPPPLPAVETGPLAAEGLTEPPTFLPPRPGVPTAPASWGPPTPEPTSPDGSVAWGSPVPAPTPAPPASTVSPPATWGAPTPPPDPNHQGPYFAYPEGQPADLVDPPIGLTDVTLPPPPPPTKPPAVPVEDQPTGPLGLRKGQLVALGAVAVVVVGLFAFMIANTGPDKAKERALAESKAKLEAQLNDTTIPPPTTTTSATTTEDPAAPATTAPVADPNAMADRSTFCRGGVAAATFELRLVAAMADQNFGELSRLVRERRARWDADVAAMKAGAPPNLQDEIARYQSGYAGFFDAIASSSTLQEAYGKVDRSTLQDSSAAGKSIGQLVTGSCS